MTPAEARTKFGRRFIGPDNLTALERLSVAHIAAPPLPFSDTVLEAYAATHLLIACPTTFANGAPITLGGLRSQFGMNSAASEPCFYNQDWYVKEPFADRPLVPGWHLIRTTVLEEARARRPEEIEAMLAQTETFPAAVTCAFAFFANWFHTGGEILWQHDFVWCRDRDHQGDRIYVGRYQDITGVNKNGFSVHRHLTLRPCYSAATEITA